MKNNNFPSYRFHSSLPPRVVQNEAEDAALGKGWYRSPADVMPDVTVTEPAPPPKKAGPVTVAEIPTPPPKKPPQTETKPPKPLPGKPAPVPPPPPKKIARR